MRTFLTITISLFVFFFSASFLFAEESGPGNGTDYVKALQQQDSYLQNQVKMYKMMHPTDHRSDDELYDDCLKQFIYQNYPIYEPVIKEHGDARYAAGRARIDPLHRCALSEQARCGADSGANPWPGGKN